MKKATLIIWVIIFGVIALLIFQNKAFFLTNQSLRVNLGIVKAYQTPELPIAILVHVCSTKVPYKTVGKEFIADRPEVKSEILNGIREVARQPVCADALLVFDDIPNANTQRGGLGRPRGIRGARPGTQ